MAKKTIFFIFKRLPLKQIKPNFLEDENSTLIYCASNVYQRQLQHYAMEQAKPCPEAVKIKFVIVKIVFLVNKYLYIIL